MKGLVRPILLLVPSVCAGLGGLVAAAVGNTQIRHAKREISHCESRLERRQAEHLSRIAEVNHAILRLGASQEAAHSDVVNRMRDFLEHHSKIVTIKERQFLDGLEQPTTQTLVVSQLAGDATALAQGLLRAAIAGAATVRIFQELVRRFASASTGTPISTLHGAAMSNALLAWAGGGAKVHGGGGKVWGRPVYIAAAAGPALFGIGLTVKNQGAKALTGAEACRAKVDELIARYDEIDVLAGGVQERASELEEILGRLARRATDALNVLESEEFDPESHGIRLQQAWNLSKAVGEVASAQIIGDDGGVSEASQALVFRYRQLPEETNHD